MTSSPPSYSVRHPKPGEEDEIGAVVAAAFGSHGQVVADLVTALRTRWANGKGFEFVAVADSGEILGHIGFTEGYLDTKEIHRVQILSPLGVRPGVHGHGIGSALVRAGLEEARNRDYDLVFLEGAPLLYPKLGFVPGVPEGFRQPSVFIPDPGFQVYFLTERGHDQSGALVYPDVFWEYECVGLRD